MRNWHRPKAVPTGRHASELSDPAQDALQKWRPGESEGNPISSDSLLFGAQDVDLSSKLLSDATIARFCQVRSVADPFIFVLVVTRRFTDCQDVLLADQNLRTLRRRQSRCSMLCSASPCNLCQAQLERLARCQTFASCADQAEGLEFNRW